MPTTRSPSTGCIASVIMPGRVGEVDDPRRRGERRDALGDVRARPGRCAGRRRRRRGRWSPGRAAPRSSATPLVGGASGQAADPDRREDEVGAARARVSRSVVRADRRARPGRRAASCARTCATTSSRRGVDVVQRRPRSTRRRAGRAAAPVDERHAEPAAAEDRRASCAHASSVSTRCPRAAR